MAEPVLATPADRGPSSRPRIGMLATGLVDLYERQWHGAVDSARAHDVDLITFVGRSFDQPGRAAANAIYDLVDADRLDGLVLWTTSLEVFSGHARVERYRARLGRIPIVSVEAELEGATSLLMDDRQGVFDAVGHLIDVHGARRIAFVGGTGNHAGMRRRVQGYRDALAAHGIAFDAALTSAGAFDPQAASRATSELLADAGGRVDAVVAANDDLALGVLIALEAHGLRTPEDVAVVGFDDFTNLVHHDLGLERVVDEAANAALLGATTLPLTTVRAPFADLGSTAVELLLARLRGEATPDVVTLPTELVVRRSCGCLAVDTAGAADSRQPSSEALERLAAAYACDIAGESEESSLAVLDELARADLRAGGSIDAWWDALVTVRRRSGRLLTTPERVARADALQLRVETLLRELAARAAGYARLVGEKRARIVGEVGQHATTAGGLERLADALVVELPRLGIPSCWLAVYEPGELGASMRSRAVLVYEDGRRRPSPPEPFAAAELVPGGLASRERCSSLVAVPLFLQDEQLGFAVLELGPRLGWVYEALGEQLSSALHSCLLIERERAALSAAEDAQQELEAALAQREDAELALQTAHAALEERVAMRTAELEHANDALRQQIEERERLEGQLLQVQKLEAIGQLAGGIAHDFNNLLIVINGYSGMLLEHLPAGDPARKDAEEIGRAGERAARLTAQLLAFSRRQLLQARALSVNEVVGELESMLRRLLGEDVELHTALGPSPRTVTVDEGQLEQVIVNLALNARDAMPDGGRLTIATEDVELDAQDERAPAGAAPGAYVAVSVADTGVGMDEATQARIFEPFFTTKPQGRGTGLGLATVFGIVRQSGGHVTVASTPGSGSTFTVYLPATGEAAEQAEPQRGTPALSGTETILVVEDDPAVRRVTRRFLEAYGYRVLEASRGHEAIRLCEEHRGLLKLVVTDVVMPEMSGRELAERLAPLLPDTRVLFMSGHTDSETVRLAEAAPTIHLLQKPFTADGLVRKVRELLDAPPPA